MNAFPSPEQAFPAITLVIPAYEPSAGLVDIVQQLSPYPFRGVVVIDDGSGEDSWAIFDQVEVMERVTLLRHETNWGKGAALKSAFRHICDNDVERTRYIVTLDADGQHSVEDIFTVAQECGVDGGKLIMGIRTFSKDIPLRSRFGNILTRRVLRWTNQVDLEDTQTELRCLPLAFAEQTLEIKAGHYEFELECILLAKRVKLPIVQHPIQTIYIESNASSHFRPIATHLLGFRPLCRSVGQLIPA
jgi:glycosyltransferase involved in cell wall biosynthesis